MKRHKMSGGEAPKIRRPLAVAMRWSNLQMIVADPFDDRAGLWSLCIGLVRSGNFVGKKLGDYALYSSVPSAKQEGDFATSAGTSAPFKATAS